MGLRHRLAGASNGVSIPRSGFRWLGPGAYASAHTLPPSFNPSVGIQVVGTFYRTSVPKPWRSFNPSVGIQVVGTSHCEIGTCGARRCFNPSVGIQVVGTLHMPGRLRSLTSFNPSVGIQVVGTLRKLLSCAACSRFQSLGRDSGGWDPLGTMTYTRNPAFQSLGRDSGGWDGIFPRIKFGDSPVSIPRSGFRWLGHLRKWDLSSRMLGFNPSVGIQVVGTWRARLAAN